MNELIKVEKVNVISSKNVFGKEVQIYGTFENPLFLAKDVAEWLEMTNVTDMISRIDKDEVTKLNLGGLKGECNFLTEDGLYEVLMQSRKPIARKFKKEVKKILKEIRVNGRYETALPQTYLEALKALVASEEKRIEAERKNEILMHVNTTYTATEIAKELNMKSANELNKALSDMKVQYKVGNTWVLYSQYSNKGYEEIKQETLDNGKVVYHRKFTQMGRDFILNLFKKAK